MVYRQISRRFAARNDNMVSKQENSYAWVFTFAKVFKVKTVEPNCNDG